MKNNIFLSALFILATALLLFLNSCAQLKTISLHKTYADIEFTIPATPVPGTIDIESEIQADLQQLAADNGFDISKIESAKVNSISLMINDSTIIPVTFDVVENATCSFFADGETIAEVGTDDAVHTSPTQLDFNLNGIDVSSYLKSNMFKAKLHLTTNAPITHDVPMKASIECTFKVKPLK